MDIHDWIYQQALRNGVAESTGQAFVTGLSPSGTPVYDTARRLGGMWASSQLMAAQIRLCLSQLALSLPYGVYRDQLLKILRYEEEFQAWAWKELYTHIEQHATVQQFQKPVFWNW